MRCGRPAEHARQARRPPGRAGPDRSGDGSADMESAHSPHSSRRDNRAKRTMSPSVGAASDPGPGSTLVGRGDERPADLVQLPAGAQVRPVLPAPRRVRRARGGGLPGPPGDGLRDTSAGLDPVAGLWACLLPLVVYALLGTSRLLSVGPESTTAIMTAAALAPLAAGDAATYATMAAFTAAAGRGDVPGRGPAAAGNRRLPAEPAGPDRLPGRGRGHHDRRAARQALRRHPSPAARP